MWGGWNQYAYPTNPNSLADPSGLFGGVPPVGGEGCDPLLCRGGCNDAYGSCTPCNTPDVDRPSDSPFGPCTTATGYLNPCSLDNSSCWGFDPDEDNTVSPGLPPAANSILTGEDCVGCYSLGASPMQVLQAVLSGNLYGALQDVGAVPTNGIDCTSGVCQISPLMDIGPVLPPLVDPISALGLGQGLVVDCSYYNFLCQQGDKYGCDAAPCCVDWGQGGKTNSVRSCLIQSDQLFCTGANATWSCRMQNHGACYAGSGFWPMPWEVPSSCWQIVGGR